jgi:hypothetical protein
VGSTTITTLPMATRNFQQILTLSVGASSDLNNASQPGRGQVFIQLNGGREEALGSPSEIESGPTG